MNEIFRFGKIAQIDKIYYGTEWAWSVLIMVQIDIDKQMRNQSFFAVPRQALLARLME